MKCKETRHHLSAFLDGELDSRTRVMVEDHLAFCRACLQMKEKLQKVYALLPENACVPEDPFIVGRVRAALTAASARKISGIQTIQRVLAPVSLAAGLMLGVLLGQNLSSHWPAEAAVTKTASTPDSGAALTLAADEVMTNLVEQVSSQTLTSSYLDITTSVRNLYE